MNEELLNEAEEERGVYALATSPAYARDGVCFAATVAGLLRSTNHGGSFEDAYASLGVAETLATPAVAVSPAFPSDHTVFAGVHGAILRSLDGGATWQYAALRTPRRW
jgi:photosystem II stability/assembly factor-like uncharacterized protein